MLFHLVAAQTNLRGSGRASNKPRDVLLCAAEHLRYAKGFRLLFKVLRLAGNIVQAEALPVGISAAVLSDAN
jgi:hypothetical protein